MPPLSPRSPFLARTAQTFLIVGSLLLHRLLLVYGYYPWHVIAKVSYGSETYFQLSLLYVLFAGSVGAIFFGFFYSPISFWIQLILCFVPLEFSNPFLRFPSLSPLDYIVFISVLAGLARFRWGGLRDEYQNAFGVFALVFWIAFLIYSLLVPLGLGGSARGSLRWIGFLWCYGLARYVARYDEDFPIRLGRLICALGFGVALLGLLQYIRRPHYVSLEGLFGQHNIFTAYLSLCIPAMAAPILFRAPALNKLRSFCLAFTSVVFLLAYGRGAWLGLAGGWLVVLYFQKSALLGRNRPRLLALTALGYLILGVIVVRQPAGRGLLSDSNRLAYLKVGKRVFYSHPWHGLGPGNYDSQIHSYLSENDLKSFVLDRRGRPTGSWVHLHNLYLQMLITHGLVGATLWFGGLMCCVYLAVKGFRRADPNRFPMNSYFMISILAFLIHNMVDIVSVNSFDMFFGVLLGTVAATVRPCSVVA